MANTKPGLFQIIRNSLWNPAHDKRSQNYDHYFKPDYLQYSESGEYVTESKGSRVSTVFNCVNLIAQDIAQTPFNVYKDSEQGRFKQPQHNTNYLINEKPNDYMTAYSFTYAMIYCYLVYGNSYAYIQRDGNRQPIGLLPLHPSAVQLSVSEGQVFATVEGMGTIPYYDILHYKLYTRDGLRGMSPIMWNANLIGKRLKEEKYSSRVLAAKPPGYLNGTANEQQQKKIAEQWKAAIHGDEVHGTPFLIGDVKYTPLNLTGDQIQFIESTIRTNIEIYGIFRVQPTMVSNFDQGVKANAEQQAINHVKFTLMPHFTMIEDEVNCKLFSMANDANRIDPYYSWHDSERFLRGDTTAMFEAYNKMIVNGTMNSDEVRAKINMPKQAGGVGEKYFIQGAMIPKGETNGEGNEDI